MMVDYHMSALTEVVSSGVTTDPDYWSASSANGTFIVNSGLTTSKIGIGTMVPNHELSVSGTISASSSLYGGVTDVTNLKIAGAQGSDGQVLTSTGSGVAWEDSSGGMTSFTVDGDNGESFPITNGETLEFVGQTGIDIGVADPEVRIAMDYNGADSFIMAATNGTSITVDGANDKLVIYDNDAAEVKYINANQLPCCSKYWSAHTTNIIRPTGDTTGVNIGGDLNVTGKTRTKGNLATENYLTVDKDMGVTGTTHIGKRLLVSGNTEISGELGIGTSPSSSLHITTADNVITKFVSTDSIATIELGDNSTSNQAILTRVSNDLKICKDGGNIGIPIAPKTKLDVQHNPTSLSNNTGGGESVTFGTASGSLTAGKLYYLNTSGVWTLTRANASSSNGNSQLLGIALGTAVSDGLLIRGFFDMRTYTEGTFAIGMPCYVSENAGYVDFTAPSGNNDFVRIVGYAIDDDSNDVLVYFDPDKTHVVIA